jgi:hypothetical protein
VLRVWSRLRHLPIITMVVIIGTAIMAGIIGTTITTIIIGIGRGLLAVPGTTVTGKAPSRATEPGALLRPAFPRSNRGSDLLPTLVVLKK